MHYVNCHLSHSAPSHYQQKKKELASHTGTIQFENVPKELVKLIQQSMSVLEENVIHYYRHIINAENTITKHRRSEIVFTNTQKSNYQLK